MYMYGRGYVYRIIGALRYVGKCDSGRILLIGTTLLTNSRVENGDDLHYTSLSVRFIMEVETETIYKILLGCCKQARRIF